MSDLISRQAAIDALADMHCKSDEDGYVWIIRSDAWWRIETLPSAEPEIVRCKDCKYCDRGIDEDGNPFLKCLGWVYGGTQKEDFCSHAERRTDEDN